MSECATFCFLEGSDSSLDLLDPPIFQGICSHIFCSEKDLLDELISYLHFMTKIFKILDFAFRPIFFEVRKGKFKEVSLLFSKALSGFGGEFETLAAFDGVPRIELRVADGLKRFFPISCIKAGNLVGFAASICLSFERTLALLLEKNQGNLPFFISPTQIRVAPLQHKHRAVAEQILFSLKEAGFRTELVEVREDLKFVLSRSLEDDVPYVVVIGDKELEDGSVTLRDVRAKKAQSLPLQELIEMLKKVN